MTHITIYINFKFNNERCCCDYKEMQLICSVMVMRDFFDFPARDRQGFLKALYEAHAEIFCPLSQYLPYKQLACGALTHLRIHAN